MLRTVLLVLAALSLCAQPVDQAYTAKIKEVTTASHFLTELVDHLPASPTVPTPQKVLGYIAGAPDKLTKTADLHRYHRELARTSPRVRTLPMGTSEEGREMLLVLISDEANLKRLDRLKEITAKLADPRKLTDADAKQLIAEGLPIYWATGSIHSSETGSPEMLMELAYRLAVEETPLIQNIRKNMVVMITPVIETDGHDRQVDLYNWKKANPGRLAPPLLYWGRYVAHDNNRDGMALALKLSQNVMRTFLEFHPQVLHDLHESVPFLYTSTGLGPYNAWLDPIVINEWQKLAWHEVEEMTKRGVPGVWTHGFYDGWAANYMFFAAQGHNSIGRFYETFGNGGADTRTRTVNPAQTTRTWYRPNPPLEKVLWSHRNNVNLQQSALLLAMNFTARNKETFLENFYLKSKRSVAKATTEGPAAWVLPGDDPKKGEQADLINLLRLHGIEVHRKDNGDFVIRMDQPYSRLADMLLDKQYYSPSDTRPYDDTGWTLTALRNLKSTRVTDPKILSEPMTLLTADAKAPFQMKGSGTAGFAIAHNHDNQLATFRFALKDVPMWTNEAAFEAAGQKFAPGAFLIKGNRDRVEAAAKELGLTVHALETWPSVAQHELAAPRIALVHTWLNTQTEGWFRIALDRLKIPYDYVSDQVVRSTPDLRARWDVILFGPTPGPAQRIVNGMPRREGQPPVPWKQSDLTPSFGQSPDQTDDIRGGMGLEGLANLSRFVEKGGLFLLIGSNSSIAIDFGLIDGVTIQNTRELNVKGSILSARVLDPTSPITYGYQDKLNLYFSQAPVFQVSRTGGMQVPSFFPEGAGRPTGRGSTTDPDTPQGRPYVTPEPKPEVKPGEEPPINEEMLEYLRPYLAPEDQRPRVVVRFAEEKELLVSGMLAGGRELALRPAIVDVPKGQGHVVLFANNPMWRHQTQGSHFLLFNAMFNFQHLGVTAKKETRAEVHGSAPGGVN